MTKEQFLHYCEDVADLVQKKHEDYQGDVFSLADYFPLGDVSYAQMLWVKTTRIVSLASQKFRIGEAPKNETLKDSARDLLAYTVFYLEYLEQEEKQWTPHR